MWQQIKNIYHLFCAILANSVHSFPSRKLRVIGVTGTDGKTTTTSLIYHILSASNKQAAMVSTIGAYIGDKHYDTGFHVTTPSSFGLQKYIKKAVTCGSEYLVIEVTSHALDQYRAFGIDFDIGVLTNITHEHLDYHKTYEKYVATKLKLLEMAKVAVINRDDESFKFVGSKLQHKSQKLITYGINNQADLTPQTFKFKTNLIGEFNKYNVLAAIAVCKELGLGNEQIRKALFTFKAPVGRQEVIYDKDFMVLIDFAHTPNSFKRLLPDVKKMVKHKLIHVFGSAGKRDASKRPIMGKIASDFDDVIVLTAEDPRGEPVEKIMNNIEEGIGNKRSLFKISDRREAIEFAIKTAEKGDVVLLTGKAHEKSMNNGHGEEPWDEFETAKRAIKNKETLFLAKLENEKV